MKKLWPLAESQPAPPSLEERVAELEKSVRGVEALVERMKERLSAAITLTFDEP